MTGKEFVEKLNNAGRITGIEWDMKGDDPWWNPQIVKVNVKAERETFSILLGYPETSIDIDQQQRISLVIVANKIMEQEGIEKKFNVNTMNGIEIADMVNYVMKILKEKKGGNDYDNE